MLLSEEIRICGQYRVATVLGESSNPMDIVGSALIIPQHTGNFELRSQSDFSNCTDDSLAHMLVGADSQADNLASNSTASLTWSRPTPYQSATLSKSPPSARQDRNSVLVGICLTEITGCP